jgi:NIMA (never in mitosis gene a)-related kinase
VSSASAKETQDAVKEGKLLAAFKHPYVVRYRESFIDSGWLCILMDYCEGGDLARQIEQAKRKHQPIPEHQVLRWMTQALLALKYIHDKHVLHRDLKSSNFFLSKAGNLKMGDFGIAKVLSCTAACARTQIGTPYYLSPEVCQEKPYTWPSDIWAMGCIFFELCERKVPFDAPNISGLVQKICRGPTPQISSNYSDFVRQLCCEMLHRNPSSRPSAETILQRPKIQEVVRQMLDEAQAAQMSEERQPSNCCSSSDAARSHRDNGVGGPESQGLCLTPLPASCGPYAESAGTYRRGDFIEYHSSTHKDWLPASVASVDAEGRIVIDLKPNTWISRETQAQQVRPRRRERDAAPAHHGGHQVPAGLAGGLICGTPMRQRSPSVGSGAPGRVMTPGRGGCFVPAGGPGSRGGSRAGTPSGGQLKL